MNLRRVNHLTGENTTALINQLGGIAGQLIDAKKSGTQLSGAGNNLANLSEQTLAALGIAQQQANNPAPPPAPNYTPIIIAVVAGLAGIGLLVFALKK